MNKFTVPRALSVPVVALLFAAGVVVLLSTVAR